MLFKINSGNQQIQPPACDPLVRFSHRLGESIRKPLWTHGVASKVLRPRFNRAQKTTPEVQMKKPICTTASARAFLICDEKCGLVRFSHRLGESIRKPLWTHGVASKVLRPRFNRAQKTTPGVQMKKPICTTASARAFLIGDEKCGLVVNHDK